MKFQISTVVKIANTAVPPIKVAYTTIIEIKHLTEKKEVNLIAIILESSEKRTFVCSDGVARDKRTLRLVDDSKHVVSLGLWSPHANLLPDSENRMMRLQNVLIGDYNNKKVLNSTVNTIADIFEDVSDSTVRQLLEWWSGDCPDEEFEEIPINS